MPICWRIWLLRPALRWKKPPYQDKVLSHGMFSGHALYLLTDMEFGEGGVLKILRGQPWWKSCTLHMW